MDQNKGPDAVRTMTKEEIRLATAPIPSLIMTYAVPSIISMVVMSIYNIVDQIFIGNGVGYLGNGATNVVYPIMVASMALGMLLGNGGTAFFSLRLGEKNYADARKAVGNAAGAIAVLSVLLAVLSGIFLEPICRLFGCTDEILPYALEYGRYLIIGIPFVSVVIVLSGFIRADGSPRVAMVMMLSGAILNTILDPIFIFVFHWGVMGAAIATSISEFLGFCIVVWYLPRFKTVKLSVRDFRPDLRILGKVCSLGASTFIAQAAMLMLIGLMNNAYVKYGAMTKYGSSIPLTAMGITSKFSQIIFSFANGTMTGAQPIIGYNYGAGNIDRVKKTYKIAAGLTVCFMVIGTVIFEVFPRQAVSLFGSESELYNEFAVRCIRIFMIMLVFNGVQASITNFFQAIGKPLYSLILSSLRQIVLLTPAILIIPLFFGLDGVLFASPVADSLSFCISVVFMLFQWKKLGTETHRI